ncbi:MAG: transposase [Treponema sp.]|jgi:hypothetical protein|nr:transposase [Treponema sp.]
MKRYSEEEKEMRAEDWKESGMSLAAYARTNGLNAQSLKNWTTVKAGRQNFVEITPAVKRSTAGIPEILIGLVQEPGWFSHKSFKKRGFLTKTAFFVVFKRVLFKN